MSAFIVEDDHIHALVTYAADKRLSYWDPIAENHINVSARNAQEVGRILMDENVRSVNYRYRESENLGLYRYQHFATPLTAIEVIKACDCLDYQSCETPNWEETIA